MKEKSWNIFLRFLFPTRCIVCEKEDESFCVSCRKNIPLRGTFTHEGIFSLWEYGHPNVHKAVLALKYKNKKMIAADMSDSLHDTLLDRLAEKLLFDNPFSSGSAFVLIPIPLSKQRFKNRGYNQAELLAKELSQKDQVSFVLETTVLYKIKDTKTQVSVKDRSKRLMNVNGSFEVKNKEKIEGKIVLLIDDVTTTGATLEEGRRMLLKAGAKLVYGITIAH